MSATEQMLPELAAVKCFAQVRIFTGDISKSVYTLLVSDQLASPGISPEQALVRLVDFIVFPICWLCQVSLSVPAYSLHTLSWGSQGSNQLLSNYCSVCLSNCEAALPPTVIKT